MAKLDQRKTLINSFHLNMEYYDDLKSRKKKNEDKIKKAQEENALISDKLRALENTMSGVKEVARQLDLFDQADYNPVRDHEKSAENAA